MVDFLFSIDLAVFYFINHTLSSPVLDGFFGHITKVQNWYITYFILWGMLFFTGGKRGKIAAIAALLLIIASDQLGSLIKNAVMRVRPCDALPDAFLPTGATGAYSFPSNHAVNNFAQATFFARLYPKYNIVLYVSASLISLSRPYLGLHYPSDTLAGTFIGIGLGLLFSIGYSLILKRIEGANNPVSAS